ncbi:AraC family transcriptional regulator N-terminal domain-containing protein [Streptomyces sp. NPDC056628]|uniref:AraC family transcriptional regulator n=1 Tax=Streptomyces sp. NPDC056628 TaxID=3345882 RepID=UPI0036747ED4
MDRLRDIRHAVTRHARDGLTATALPRVSVLRTPRTIEPHGGVLEPAFILVVGGAKTTTLNGETYSYGAGHYFITSVDLPVIGGITTADADDPYMSVTIRLDPDKIASLLLDAGLPRGGSGPRAASAFGVGRATPALLDAVARLLALLDHPADLAALSAGTEREVLWRLLTGPQGAAVRQIGIADSRLAHVARATRWIRDHYHQPLRIPDLAATAAMSPASLHRHFLALTSMTPLEYQKQLRLNDARTRLLNGDHHIAEVGFAVGYTSPSQFSREYRRMFGATPSQTTQSATPPRLPG